MATPTMSDTTTHGVRVGATAFYLPDESDPERKQFMFGYRILILNEGDASIKLLSRHWLIINGEGVREEVDGPGVVGQTPLLEPGQAFKYTSYCPLTTPWGTMEGEYTMEQEDGTEVKVKIGRFYLVKPREEEQKP